MGEGRQRGAAGRLTFRAALFFACAGTPIPAFAGPPFLTDDPVPAEFGEWEVYAPLIEFEGRGGASEGAVGIEANYGAAPGLQLSVTLPVTFARGDGEIRWGRGDVEFAAKYRFYHDEGAGVTLAIEPEITLPTGRHDSGDSRVAAFLPVWAQKDFGQWSVFGGGGYAINPDPDERDYWEGGVAVTRSIGSHVTLGVEATRHGAESRDERAVTSLGVGTIVALSQRYSLLASAGPSFEDGHRTAGFHGFVALELGF